VEHPQIFYFPKWNENFGDTGGKLRFAWLLEEERNIGISGENLPRPILKFFKIST